MEMFALHETTKQIKLFVSVEAVVVDLPPLLPTLHPLVIDSETLMDNVFGNDASNIRLMEMFALHETTKQIKLFVSVEAVVVDLPPLLPTLHPLVIDSETLMDNVFGNDASNIRLMEMFALHETTKQIKLFVSVEAVVVDLPPLLPTLHPLVIDSETLMDNVFGNDASNIRLMEMFALHETTKQIKLFVSVEAVVVDLPPLLPTLHPLVIDSETLMDNVFGNDASNIRLMEMFALHETTKQIKLFVSVEAVVVDLPPLLPTLHPLVIDSETLMDNVFGNDASNIRFDGASVEVGNMNSVHGDAQDSDNGDFEDDDVYGLIAEDGDYGEENVISNHEYREEIDLDYRDDVLSDYESGDDDLSHSSLESDDNVDKR
ncbi:unnamed protein product [Ilex paraguariensis]|uniref:Uncharacterized protein n=1 Tax=Ilex paraguariensis TaxID=185542 RepID=A0ABC8V5G2_9AQUA